MFSKRRFAWTVALVLLALGAAAAQNPTRLATVEVGEVETFVALDKSLGQLPEGVTSDRFGTVYYTLAPLGQIHAVDRWGARRLVASLGSPPFAGPGALGLETDLAGNVYVAMATFEGDSHGVWRIHPGGAPERLAGSLGINFPNSLTFDERGNLYVTDSLVVTSEGLKGRVWRVPPDDAAEIWSESPLLAGVVNPVTNPIGANGIAYQGKRLVVANTTRRTLVTIDVEHDGSAGDAAVLVSMDAFLPPEPVPPLFVPLPPLLDGVTVDAQGNLYALVVGQHKLVRLPPDGSELTVLADFGDGLQVPASAAFGTAPGERSTLYVTNFVFLPGVDHAAVLAIDVGVPGSPVLGPALAP